MVKGVSGISCVGRVDVVGSVSFFSLKPIMRVGAVGNRVLCDLTRGGLAAIGRRPAAQRATRCVRMVSIRDRLTCPGH
jgi:hypothetical protein